MYVKLVIREPKTGRIVREIKMTVDGPAWARAGGLPTDKITSLSVGEQKIRCRPYYRRTVNGELRIFALEVPNE